MIRWIFRSRRSQQAACLLLLLGVSACTGAPPVAQDAATSQPTAAQVEPAYKEAAPTDSSSLAEPAATSEPTQAASSVEPVAPAAPTGAFVSPPLCAQEILAGSEQEKMLAQPATAQRAALLAGSQGGEMSILGDTPAQNALIDLATNVAAGQFNRDTGIQISELPEIQTVGALMDQLASPDAADNPALVAASAEVLTGEAVNRPVCSRLIVTNFATEPAQVRWQADGIQAEQPLRAEQPGRLVKDTGRVSPDGKQVAYTSLAGEVGGPVFVNDLQTGASTNLIDAMNAQLREGSLPLPADWFWEVIGWMPDSSRLMIAPSDITTAFVVETATGSFQSFPYETGSIGGSRVLDLAPDGSRIVWVRMDETGAQSIQTQDLRPGMVTTLYEAPAEAGTLWYPRFAPDSSQIAFLAQRGSPSTGLTYAIQVLAGGEAAPRTLVEGNLGMSVPVWSPDGQQIAFTKREPDELEIVSEDMSVIPQRGNIWMVALADGALTQLTFIDGWARSPAWDLDSRTLAFVTGDGAVGMVQTDRPGQAWLAAQADPANALYTTAFFVP